MYKSPGYKCRMSDRTALGLIVKISDAQDRITQMKNKFDAWFIQRYGVHYSEVDCDSLIDVLDYNSGNPPRNLLELDEWMAASGVKPIKQGNL